eukprot:253758-Prymnesium_polylepis.1
MPASSALRLASPKVTSVAMRTDERACGAAAKVVGGCTKAAWAPPEISSATDATYSIGSSAELEQRGSRLSSPRRSARREVGLLFHPS